MSQRPSRRTSVTIPLCCSLFALAPLTEGRAFGSAPQSQPVSIPAPSKDDGAGTVEEADAVSANDAVAASAGHTYFGDTYPQQTRGITLHLPRVTRRNALELLIDHRTNQPVQDNTWHDYFGFDAGGLKIGLGLRFGVYDNIDVGVYRLNSATERFDVYEFDTKIQLLRQNAHFVDAGLRAGITWFSQQDADDAVGGFGQLLLSRRFFDRLTVGTLLLFHSDSTNGVKASTDTQWSLAAGLLTDLRVLGWLSFALELSQNLAGYGTRNKFDTDGSKLSSVPCFAFATRFITYRHTFAFVLSNNPYVSADGYVANTQRGFDKLIVGFTLTREWNF